MPSRQRLSGAGGRLAALGLLAALACGGEPAPPEGGEADARQAVEEAPAAPNAAPRVRGLRFDPDPPLPGGRVVARAEGIDPDGDLLRLVYAWRLDGERAGRGEGSFAVPEGSKGAELEVTVIAHDGELESEPVRASTRIGNRPPELLELRLRPPGEVRAGDEITASPVANDPDGDPVRFEYVWRVNGRRLEESGPALRAPHFQRGDRVELVVRASDGEAESEPLATPAIEIANSPPVITSQPSGLDGAGSFSYSPVVEDADGDRRLRFRLVEAPEGMSIDWLGGRVSWTPQDEQGGKHDVEIEVDDMEGGVTTQRFVLDVKIEKPEAPAEAAPAAAAP